MIIKSAISLLLPREKGLLLLAILIQAFLSLADVLGIALVGAIGSLGFTYIAGLALPLWVGKLLQVVGLGDISVQRALFFTSIMAALLFVGKSLLTLVLSRRIFMFLANRQTRIASETARKIANAPFIWIKNQNIQNLIYTITDGSNAIILGVVGNLVTIVSELILLVLILIVLFSVNFSLALASLLFFGGVALFISNRLGKFASEQGKLFSETAMQGRNYISALLMAYREIFTLQRQDYFLLNFEKNRKSNSSSSAATYWMQQIPKTLAEITLVVGAGTLVGFQVLQSTANDGIGVLLLFLAAASRLTPSLLKLQGAFIYTKNYSAAGEITMRTLEELDGLQIKTEDFDPDFNFYSGGPVKVQVRDARFKYPDGLSPAVENISVTISKGSIVALAGSSGSGKTTLADLILGIFTLDSGDILINHESILDWRPKNLGGIGYVPQSPFLLPGTLLENIALGIPLENIDLNRIYNVLETCQLNVFVEKLPQGLNTIIGELGGRLSGGERQRIAIARALYPNPALLIIDEGTSALDAKTEYEITNTLHSLGGNTTVILIAHRLASIKNVDQIYFLSEGRLVAQGTFDELKNTSAEFRNQVELMQLR